MTEPFGIQTIRYAVTLIFGICITASFAGLLNNKKNYIKLALLTVVLIILQAASFVTFGFEYTLSLYPVHTHLVLILALVLVFGRNICAALTDTLLAYMCCQIPRWLASLVTSCCKNSDILEFIVYLLVALLSIYLINRYVSPLIYDMINESKSVTLTFAIIPAIYYLFDFFTTVWTRLLYTGGYLVTQFMPSVICIAYMVFAVKYSREHNRMLDTKVRQFQLENELNIVETEMENLSRLNRMAQVYRHDMRHHLTLIKHYIEQEQTAEAIDYINDNVKNIDDFTPRRFCDMDMLNLLFSHFFTEAENMGVASRFDIRLPEKLPLTNTELCSLVSNAVENALEALKDVEQQNRKLDVRLCEFNGKLLFSVDNTCKSHVEIIENIPRSNRKGHGYGTKSIAAVANEHGGTVDFKTENDMFRLMVVVPL